MDLQMALVCDEARETPDGKLDATGVFNDLFAPGFPARQDRMVLVVALEWDRSDDGRHRFRVDLLDPSGSPSLTVEGETDVDKRTPDRPPARTRLIMPLENVVFPTPGAYRFRIRVKGRVFDGPPLHLLESPPVDGSPAESE